MNKTAKTVLTAAAAAAGAAGIALGASYAVAKLFLGEALEREEPWPFTRRKKSFSGVSSKDEGLKRALEAGQRLRASGVTERIELTARDGAVLVGHWRPHPEAKRVLVAMHGWRSAWYTDFGLIGEFAYENGCSILYAEQRGQGESGGAGMGFGVLERFDCADWANWVSEATGGELPIYLSGLSMGATTVLMAAGLGGELPDAVRGVIADCGFTSPGAIWKVVAENTLKLPYALWKRQVDRLCSVALRCAPDECSTVEALKTTTLPVLLVHGTADTFVPVSMTLENYAACASPKRLLLVPDAGHAMSYVTDTAAYERAVLEFWREFDG